MPSVRTTVYLPYSVSFPFSLCYSPLSHLSAIMLSAEHLILTSSVPSLGFGGNIPMEVRDFFLVVI